MIAHSLSEINPIITPSGHLRKAVQPTSDGFDRQINVNDAYNMLETALWYARGGWSVFPCVPGDKNPITEHGLKDATCDAAVITNWWQQTPGANQTSNANIGLNAGASGLIVIDFDAYKPVFAGGDLLSKLLADYPTTTADSARGGVHLIYQQPEGIQLGNKRGTLPAGVDVRGHGGYIVLAPSILNENGRRYMWRAGLGPHQLRPQPLPAFLLEILQSDPKKPERKPAMHTNDTTPHTATDDYESAKRALAFIGKWRADDYNDWIAVGMALHPLGHAGLALWDDWSSVSNKYTPGACEKKWTTFADDGGLGIGSLVHWAKQDSPDIYTTPTPAPPAWLMDAPPQEDRRVDPKTGEIMTFAKEQPSLSILVEPDSAPDNSVEEDSAEGRHPLDVEIHRNLRLGWIDDYADLAVKMNGSPRQFHVLAALTVAATAMQGKGRLRMAFAPSGIYPNIYCSINAPTTVFGKTTAIDHARYVLNEARLQKLIPPTHSTSEGLIKALSFQPAALMLRNEISGLLSSDKTRYLKDYKLDLTELYDCKPYGRRLSNEEIKVDRPYLNILGGTTPEGFYASVAHSDWAGGLLVRFVYAIPGVGDKPNFRSENGMYNDDYDGRLKSVARKLEEIDRQREVDFQLASGVFDMWSDWRATALEYAYNQQDNMSMAIIARYAIVALKLSMILSAVNGDWGRISTATMQTAMNLADNFKGVVYRILTESDNYKITGAKVQKVFAVIKNKNTGDGVTERMIKQYTKLSSMEITPCLDEMKALGVISDKKVGRTMAFFAMVQELPIRKWSSA